MPAWSWKKTFSLRNIHDTTTHYAGHEPTLHTTGGWWHLNWGGQARSNDWSGISGMVSNTPNTWPPGVWCHSRRSGHYYEPFSPQHPPVLHTLLISVVVHPVYSATSWIICGKHCIYYYWCMACMFGSGMWTVGELRPCYRGTVILNDFTLPGVTWVEPGCSSVWTHQAPRP